MKTKMQLLAGLVVLLALTFSLASCSDDDEPDNLSALGGTEWEGSLVKRKGGIVAHSFAVTLTFTGDHTAYYTYGTGGSSFTYDLAGTSMYISQCSYSNINGTWNLLEISSKRLVFEKTDGQVVQRWTLKRKTASGKDEQK